MASIYKPGANPGQETRCTNCGHIMWSHTGDNGQCCQKVACMEDLAGPLNYVACNCQAFTTGARLIRRRPLSEEVNRVTLRSLDAAGYRGQDASTGESLYYYGLIWRNHTDSDDVSFIYGVEWREREGDNGGFVMFDKKIYPKNLDVEKEWDWAVESKPSFFHDLRCSKEDWLKMPLYLKVVDLFNAYGAEEIFGTCYSGGFPIDED